MKGIKGVGSRWVILTAVCFCYQLHGVSQGQIGVSPGQAINPITGKKVQALAVLEPVRATPAESARSLEMMRRSRESGKGEARKIGSEMRGAGEPYHYVGHNWEFDYLVSHDNGTQITGAFYKGVYLIATAYVPWLGIECDPCEVTEKFELTSDTVVFGPSVGVFPGFVAILTQFVVGTSVVTEEFFFFDDGHFIPSLTYWDYSEPRMLECVPIYVDWDIYGSGYDYACYWWNAWHVNHYEFALSRTSPHDPAGYNVRLGDTRTEISVLCKEGTDDSAVQFVERLGIDLDKYHPVRGIIYPAPTYEQDNVHIYMIRNFESSTEHHPEYLIVLP